MSTSDRFAAAAQLQEESKPLEASRMVNRGVGRGDFSMDFARFTLKPGSTIRDAGVLKLALQEIPSLPDELKRLLRQIPRGRVTTYGDLARALGDVKAARWVGEYLLAHAHDGDCPCHRVVRVDGRIGLYVTRDGTEKAALLRSEGVRLESDRVDLKRYRIEVLDSASPLSALHDLQVRLPDELELTPLPGPIRSIGGVDVSYVSPQQAVGAFVLLDVATRELVWSTTVRAAVTFPYISGYLTFRELPVYLKLIDQVRAAGRLPDVTFVDGNGILHPRRAGIASSFGLAAGIPTIGVGKKLLCGQVSAVDSPVANAEPVIHDGCAIGFAVKAGRSNRPFYVSPGHLVDLASTLTATQLVLGERRLPLPIAAADRISRIDAMRTKVS